MLEHVDLTLTLDREEYEKQLLEAQLRLVRAQPRLRKEGIPVAVMYEGLDASGKGGSILRITEKMDPRGYTVWPVGAPTDIEKQYHYLWRFWTRLPARGHLTIFDRSWYGRVLVERVEKLARPDEWRRTYEEIRDFERCVVDNGTVLVKFWMHISSQEQLNRFRKRESDPFKQWKIGPDDWRNRERWDDYLAAAEDMFAETDTDFAPWRIIPAECKRYARVDTARILADAMESALQKRAK